MLKDLIKEYVVGLYDLSTLRSQPSESEVEGLAEGWLNDVELNTGREIAPGARSQVVRYVGGRLPGLLVRFRGNVDAARLTMLNLLDMRFSDLRLM